MWFTFAFFVTVARAGASAEYPLAVQQDHGCRRSRGCSSSRATRSTSSASEESALLDSYGWVDKDAGTVHIPIEDAMRLTLERGLPVAARGATGAQPATTRALMPTDSSSGRVMERRRQ